MKTKITLELDRDLVRKVEALAARRGTSVRRLLAEQLEQLVGQDRAYEVARRRALARLAEGFDLGWVPPAARDTLHER